MPEWLVKMGTDGWFVAADRARHEPIGDLIVVGTPELNELVLLDGHARLTAVFVGGLDGDTVVSAYVGTSPAIRQWELF